MNAELDRIAEKLNAYAATENERHRRFNGHIGWMPVDLDDWKVISAALTEALSTPSGAQQEAVAWRVDAEYLALAKQHAEILYEKGGIGNQLIANAIWHMHDFCAHPTPSPQPKAEASIEQERERCAKWLETEAAHWFAKYVGIAGTELQLAIGNELKEQAMNIRTLKATDAQIIPEGSSGHADDCLAGAVGGACTCGAVESIEQAAERDAERYRWLRNSGGRTNRLPHVTQYPDDPADYIQVWDKKGYHPERLDAAIDAAIRGGEK